MNFTCNECNDTGSRDKSGDYLDCGHCDAAMQRAAMNDFLDKLPAMGDYDAAWLVHQRALAMAPKQEAPALAFDAATFIEKKAASYLDENSSTDPDDGSIVFHYGSAGSEYYNGLVELAEEIRLAAPAAANGALTDKELADPEYMRAYVEGCNDSFNEAMAEISRLRAILAAAVPDAALVTALEKIIEMNVQYCIDKYGDASKAEAMGCVTTARAALSGAKGN